MAEKLLISQVFKDRGAADREVCRPILLALDWNMGKKTPKHHKHVEAGARMVDFGGWDMPLHYGSQKEEHHAVRRRAGAFDVSHMTIVDLKGERAQEFLRYLLANDVAKLKESGKAL